MLSSCIGASYKPKTIFQKAWSVYRKAFPSQGLIFVVKRKVFQKLGGFNEKIFYFEDAEFTKRFHKAGYKYKGPINAKVYHIEVENWNEFIRQRKWQGRMASLRYFLPCVFPPLMFIQLLKIYKGSNELKTTFLWILLDFIGRYISLFERIRINLKISL